MSTNHANNATRHHLHHHHDEMDGSTEPHHHEDRDLKPTVPSADDSIVDSVVVGYRREEMSSNLFR